MSDIIVALLASIPAAIIAGIGLWVQHNRNKTEGVKIKADTADSITDSAILLIDPLKVRITELEAANKMLNTTIAELSAKVITQQAELEKMQAQVDENTQYIERLCHQVKSLGHEPIARKFDRFTKPYKEVE
jgi:uncharacterized coiled-coil protein SlyX